MNTAALVGNIGFAGDSTVYATVRDADHNHRRKDEKSNSTCRNDNPSSGGGGTSVLVCGHSSGDVRERNRNHGRQQAVHPVRRNRIWPRQPRQERERALQMHPLQRNRKNINHSQYLHNIYNVTILNSSVSLI